LSRFTAGVSHGRVEFRPKVRCACGAPDFRAVNLWPAAKASAGEAGTRDVWSSCVSPLDRLRAVEAEAVGEGLRDVEVPAGDIRTTVDHLRQDLLAVKADVDLHAARKHRMRDPLGLRGERIAAGRAWMRRGRTVRRGTRGVVPA